MDNSCKLNYEPLKQFTYEVTVDNYTTPNEGRYAIGWYFIDETGRIDQNGPYKTKAQAEKGLKLYVLDLLDNQG